MPSFVPAALLAAILAATATTVPSAVPTTGPLDGNALLREAARRNPLPRTYSVPMNFRVHLQRPVGIRVAAAATTYFKSPDRQALVITSLPRILTKKIASSYGSIDTVSQAWAKKYTVNKVTPTDLNGEPAYQLDSVPNYTGDITRVVFTLLRNGLVPVGAQWFWRDGSSVALTVRNKAVGRYLLPAHEDIVVVMPKFALDASGDSGDYTIDADLPAELFSQ